jgi:Protein of unknown function (DUF2933)
LRELLFVFLVLACPLMMVLMMRGHGKGGHWHGPDDERWPELTSTAELLRQRDALDRLIEERKTVTPVGRGDVGHDGDRSPSG